MDQLCNYNESIMTIIRPLYALIIKVLDLVLANKTHKNPNFNSANVF